MKNIFRTGDRRTDFIIENYAKVMDLNECMNHAESHYPDALQKQVRILLEDWKYNPVLEEANIWWSNEGYYDRELGIGLYYSIEEFNWDSLVWEGGDNYPIFICLAVDRSKKHGFARWLDHTIDSIEKNKKKLGQRGITVVTDKQDWGDCLASMYLNRELGIEALKSNSFASIKENLRNKLRVFTDSFMGSRGILKPFFR